MPSVRIAAIAIKSPHPEQLADFWRELLGYVEIDQLSSSIRLEDPEGRGPSLLTQPATGGSEGGMIHLDLDLRPDDQAPAMARALELGAVRASVGHRGDEAWEVLADPDGNTFCLLAAASGGREPVVGGAAAIASVERPVTLDDIVDSLRAVGVAEGGTIIVHTSLSRLGWVVGGAHSVLRLPGLRPQRRGCRREPSAGPLARRRIPQPPLATRGFSPDRLLYRYPPLVGRCGTKARGWVGHSGTKARGWVGHSGTKTRVGSGR